MQPYRDAVARTPAGAVRFPTFEGDDVYSAWAPIGATGWRVGVASPAAPVDRSLALWIAGVAGAGVLGGGLGMAWARRFAHRVEAPIVELAEASRRVPFELPDAFDPQVAEIGDLAAAMRAGHERQSREAAERRLAEGELAEAARRKDEFLATLAHELRNPLAPVRNSLHLMRLAGPGSEAVKAGPLLDLMERQVAHLVRLVDDLMEVARITRGRIELRPERIDLAAALRSAAEAADAKVRHARCTLELKLPPEPLWVRADPVRLAQVFVNLLDNAAKYSAADGRIVVTLRREGDEAAVSVCDTGAGIPAEMLARVFDLFAQVDRTLDRAQGGLGIGLALARNLLELHGGRIEARSEGVDCGSEFLVHLPLAAAADPAAAPEDAPEAALGDTHRVLVVDDNRDAADTLAPSLRRAGAIVEVRYDGASAIDAARRFQPDALLLDLGMQDIDGFAVANALRAEARFAATTIVALSGWSQPIDRQRTRAAGFDAHLAKPAPPQQVIELLRTLRARAEGLAR
jgi:signal transduction histidine kinase/ActR/RegA family two-component response regulator